MENWAEVIQFMAKRISEAENLAEYYRAEKDRLETENIRLRQYLEMLGGSKDAENALETAR